jgi:nitrogen regulatory protein PII
MEERCLPKKIKLLITIVDRGNGEKIAELLRENNVIYNMILLGNGTAKSEILDYLGLGRTEKDIVLSVVNDEDIDNILKNFNEKMNMSEPGNGVAFTIPISSVDSSMALEFICSFFEGRKE